MEIEELVNKITKEADLDFHESEMLLHDINDLRGDEWLEIIIERCKKETIKEFEKILQQLVKGSQENKYLAAYFITRKRG